MFYKTEAYIGSEYAGKILNENNLTVVYVSDNPVINAQHVLFEAAKAWCILRACGIKTKY